MMKACQNYENIIINFLFYYVPEKNIQLSERLLLMTISFDQKKSIEKVLTESLTTWDELFNIYNFFSSNEPNDTNGDIGWDILNRIAENNKKCRNIIQSFPEKVEVQREIGNYVLLVIRKKIGEFSN